MLNDLRPIDKNYKKLEILFSRFISDGLERWLESRFGWFRMIEAQK